LNDIRSALVWIRQASLRSSFICQQRELLRFGLGCFVQWSNGSRIILQHVYLHFNGSKVLFSGEHFVFGGSRVTTGEGYGINVRTIVTVQLSLGCYWVHRMIIKVITSSLHSCLTRSLLRLNTRIQFNN